MKRKGEGERLTRGEYLDGLKSYADHGLQMELGTCQTTMLYTKDGHCIGVYFGDRLVPKKENNHETVLPFLLHSV